jgi:hypothetical protein
MSTEITAQVLTLRENLTIPMKRKFSLDKV